MTATSPSPNILKFVVDAFSCSAELFFVYFSIKIILVLNFIDV